MKLRLSVLLACLACGVTSVARAQVMTSTSGPGLETMSYGLQGISPRNGPVGAKLGEGTLLHAALGADIGYDSNVFYEHDSPHAAAVAHVTPAIEISNGERDGSTPDGVFYDLGASLTYREYLSGGDAVRKMRAFNPGIGGLLRLSSKQTLSLSLSDNFARTQDPPYSLNAAIITHDRNLASLELKVAPGGGRIQVLLRLNNVLDLYETTGYEQANNMGNEAVLDLSWRWLPRTALFVQVAQGAVTYLKSDSTGVASYPLRATAGLRGLLTEKLGLNLAAGYANGFYASGVNTSGFGSVVLVGELLYNMSLTSKVGLGYRHDFVNSPFVGPFYNMDAVYAALHEYIGGRVATAAYARFENRAYQGAGGRTDQVVIGGLTADYVIQRFFYIGLGYTLTLARTNNTATTTPGVDYTKHLIVARLGVVY